MNALNADALDVGRIWDAAVGILENIGFEIANEDIRRRLTDELPQRAGRFCIDRPTAEHFADEIRSRFGRTEPAEAPPPDQALSIFNSPLNTHWLDPADGSIKPHTTEDVIRHTKLTGQLADEGLMGCNVAGTPQDVAPPMQFLTVQYLQCVYHRTPWAWSLMLCEDVLPWFREVADIMGFEPVIAAEMISPLRFQGTSIDLGVKYGSTGQIRVSGVDPMPVLGVTAPSDWHGAWALSVAENVGSYAMFRLCGVPEPGPPSFRLFLPNPASATTYFSSPQHIFALLTRRKVHALFGMAPGWGEMLLSASKAADAQAAAEKTAGCLLGKLAGFPCLEGAGGLWMDEIFSPQQLLIDIEIKHFADGVRSDLSPGDIDIEAAVREGVEAGGFLQTDMTLDRFGDFLWKAQLFDLRPRGAWTGDRDTMLRKAAAIAGDKAAAWDYELSDHRREALDRLMERARQCYGDPSSASVGPR